MRSPFRRQRGIVSVLFAAIIVSVVGCSDNEPTSHGSTADSSASSVSVSAETANGIDALQQRAYELHRAIFARDYETAFDMRSSACKAALPFDEFKRAVDQEFDGKPNPPLENLRFLAMTAQNSGPLAYAQVQAYEVGQENNPDNEAPRRWKFEDGLWKFDNCGDEE